MSTKLSQQLFECLRSARPYPMAPEPTPSRTAPSMMPPDGSGRSAGPLRCSPHASFPTSKVAFKMPQNDDLLFSPCHKTIVFLRTWTSYEYVFCRAYYRNWQSNSSCGFAE